MTYIQKLESDTFRLKDIQSLRHLFAGLNYEYEDKPVDKQYWNQKQKDIVLESRIVARKDNYFVYYIKTNSDTVKEWKEIATKIISVNNGFCLVCSHNLSGFQWIFSSISKEFSKSFSETRHIPIEIKPNVGVPKPFLEFLEAIRVEDSDNGINILNKISEAFDKFSLQIHDELTINVFEALKTFSEGIITDEINKTQLSNESLEKIREPIFILLYRIIFALYAEDRSIFPIENDVYYNKFSIKWIKHNWILNSTHQHKLSEYEIQNRLKKLFRLIEVGSEELGYEKGTFLMRSYYGRLFDRKINFQIEKWAIPNKYYIKAIELLTSTRDKKGNRFFLDYAALDVRHLGSIYERLLEFHLTVKNKSIADLPSPKDRRASGSYYTPQYIVDYIVTHSIGPVIDKIIKDAALPSVQIEKILSLNILDPAMGSGHFLVGATEYLAKRICEIENKMNAQNYVERKRDVVRRCIYGVDLNPLAVDLAALSLWLETLSSEKPLSFLSAHLKVGNSLVGSKIQEIFEKQTTLFESEKGRELFNQNVKDYFIFENLRDDTSSAVKAKVERFETIKTKGTIYYELKFLLDSKLSESLGIKVPALGDYRAKIGENSIDFYSYDAGPKIKDLSNKHRFFHWELEFPDIFFDGNGDRKNFPGFDIILGNPPYLNIKGVRANDVQLPQYFKERYESATERYDLYVLFIEMAAQLLRKEGTLSYILPHKFTNSNFGKGIRLFLSRNKLLNVFISFGHNRVFEDSTTYTGILTLSNTQNAILKYAEIDSITLSSLEEVMRNLNEDRFQLINNNTLNEKPWILKSGIDFKILDKIRKSGQDIRSYFEIILNGLQTEANEIYILTPKVQSAKIMTLYSDKIQSDVQIEKEMLKPLLKGEDIKRFAIYQRIPHYVIYPYVVDKEGQRRIEERELRKYYPLTSKYLSQFKKELIKLRTNFKTNPEYWHVLHRGRRIEWFQQTKIITPEITLGCNMTLDENKFFHNETAYSFLKKNSTTQDIKFFLAILNSKLLWFFVKNTGNILRGGFFRFKTQYLEPFCIPSPTLEIETKFVNRIDEIFRIKKSLLNKSFDSDSQKKIIRIESEINQLVYQLYGLTEDEIKVVESNYPN